jgi:hypothetical protein
MAEERRIVTVLFADVAGSTAMGDVLDPEDVRALLTHSLELLVRVGATPYSARVRCDRALLTGDHAELEAGLRVLEDLGDTDQRERYQRRAVG